MKVIFKNVVCLKEDNKKIWVHYPFKISTCITNIYPFCCHVTEKL